MIRVLNIISDTNIGGGGRSLLSYLQYYDRGRYKNMAILLNGTDIYSGYGYHRYGRHYGYRYSAAADGSYYAD